MTPLNSTDAARFLRGTFVVGAVLVVAGLLVDASPVALSVRLRDVTGGLAVAALGGGLVMVATTVLAGLRLFAPPRQPERAQDDS